MPQDYRKALELWHRAAKLGYAEAYNNIGYAYKYGRGVETDKKKGVYYYELAAMGGDVAARFNLGNNEERMGNFDRAIKHWMIAVGGGSSKSLKKIQELYSDVRWLNIAAENVKLLTVHNIRKNVKAERLNYMI